MKRNLAGAQIRKHKLGVDRGTIQLFGSNWQDQANQILIRVAGVHDLTVDALTSSRVPRAVIARRDWLRLVQYLMGLSASDTARLCNVDHTTVLRAWKFKDADASGSAVSAKLSNEIKIEPVVKPAKHRRKKLKGGGRK